MATQTAMSPALRSQFEANMMKTVEPEDPRVPLVGHIITDEDVGALKGSKLQAINLNKVVKLLVDPHSAMLYDRHVHAMKKMVKCYSKGFLMRDLVIIFKILNVCADRIEDVPIYMEPMTNILTICSLPFIKEKTSDETSFEQIAIESVAQLGYLMRVPSSELRLQICRTLVNFYCEKPPPQNIQKHKANTQEYNKKIVEKSDIAETLVKSLALIDNDISVKLAVLDILQRLSSNSSANCNQMLGAGAATRLASRLMDHDSSGQLLFRSVDILWNLLENGDTELIAQQLNNLTCISQLRDAFIQQLTSGYSHYDRQLRNDLLTLASLIASACTDTLFVETGFVKQLTLFATFQEVKSHHVLVKHLKLLQNHEDFELKKQLINILTVLSKDSAVLPVLSEGKLLLALFGYVKANERQTGPRDWTPAQFEELQLHALASLCTLGPLMIDEYMMCQGSTRLLLLLEWCTGSDDFGGQGNSFHGIGGRDNKRAQMRYCLRLIRSMVSTGEDAVLQDLVDQGAIHQLTGILQTMVRQKQQRNAIDVEMQCDMLFILSSLCEGDQHRKELFGESGVDVVIEYLRTDSKLLSSGVGHHRLMLTAVDCIWCAVVGCYQTEDYYLEKEGVFLLVDMLQSCPKNMHNLVLGVLLDLLENPKAIPHMNSWRGKSDISTAHLLCNIWRDEEAEIGVPREKTGAIADFKKPLMGSLQEQQGVISLPANCPSQAIVDVSENMRAKIYSLFCKIGFIELPGLTTEDHVTLTIVEHYLDFKLGEVWTEVISELDQEEVRPVTPDREALEAVTRTVEDRASHVVQVQQELLEAQKQQDLIEEQEYYAEIRENHRQKEKAIRDFSGYVARTSNFQLLKAAKDRQELSIDASRIQNNYKSLDAFHSTDLPGLHTTQSWDELPPDSPDSSDTNVSCCEVSTLCNNHDISNSGDSGTSNQWDLVALYQSQVYDNGSQATLFREVPIYYLDSSPSKSPEENKSHTFGSSDPDGEEETGHCSSILTSPPLADVLSQNLLASFDMFRGPNLTPLRERSRSAFSSTSPEKLISAQKLQSPSPAPEKAVASQSPVKELVPGSSKKSSSNRTPKKMGEALSPGKKVKTDNKIKSNSPKKKPEFEKFRSVLPDIKSPNCASSPSSDTSLSPYLVLSPEVTPKPSLETNSSELSVSGAHRHNSSSL